jgi:predicted metal-dependent phosphoesterase TrpH
MRIDLHTHTSCSDGVLTPTELLGQAKEARLDVLGLTDHDTMAGLDEAEAEAERHGIRLIPGIELSVYAMEREVHILGYFIDRAYGPFQEFIEEQREARIRRIHRMLDKLRTIGVDIAPEDVIEEGKQGTTGRPHVARAMVRHGYIENEDAAFHGYIGRDQPGYVPRVKVSAAEGVRRLEEAGAVPVLAHPGLYGREGLIDHMIESGIRGIEAYHPDHSDAAARRYVQLAEEKGLLVTGGSDYHGKQRGRRFNLGYITIPESLLERLEAAARG